MHAAAIVVKTSVPRTNIARGFYPKLIEATVVRHEQVSSAKNRPLWLYQDGGDLVKDDPRPMAFGWHAMRFPQVAICTTCAFNRRK